MKLVRRDLRIAAGNARRRMTAAIARWIEECTSVTDGGAVAPDRAWECFRDWVREQQAVSRSDESLTGVLNDDLFHSVMEAERPARGALYLVTIDPSFVARGRCGPKIRHFALDRVD